MPMTTAMRTADPASELRWTDRVYGPVVIDDPKLLALIGCPTFQRLRGIRQAGPSALAFPFKTVSRYEHSLGVFLLLRRLGAERREQVAGLLHDISHTAFSHAVDFLITSEEQAHHEQLKPLFLERPDLASALAALGFAPSDFFEDSAYRLLERPLPWLCADRLDYFLRDGLACAVCSPEAVARFLAHLTVIDGTMAFTSATVAQEAVDLFGIMNRDWWASPTEAYIYNEFAHAIREGIRLGAITEADLMEDDAHVLERLQQANTPFIRDALARIRGFCPTRLNGYVPQVIPKIRWLDPPVTDASAENGWRLLSEYGSQIS